MLRVASVPASHVYVRHLAFPNREEASSVVRLNDPVPSDGRKVPGGWWPPLMLEPGWISDNHRQFDVFHLHFGFDAITPQVLADVAQELKAHGKPLVYTIHDLRNPHHPEPEAHAEQQAVLISAAQSLITLTVGAAQAVSGRWDRRAHVLPHPHVLDRARIARPRGHGHRFVVGVHVKSLRANMDPLPIVAALTDIVAELPRATLQVDIHDEIFDPDNHWFAPKTGAALMDYRRRPNVDVRVHSYFSDAELWDYLAALTVSVLPYRFGTHSGWLEACYDLGTAVVAPSCGFYHQQRPCGVFDFDESRFDVASLDRAIRDAHCRWAAGEPAPRARWQARLDERRELARAHLRLYEAVLA